MENAKEALNFNWTESPSRCAEKTNVYHYLATRPFTLVTDYVLRHQRSSLAERDPKKKTRSLNNGKTRSKALVIFF
jgi:hypothetical protein